MFGNMKLFLVLNRISHSFALLTREIFGSTLEINFIFPNFYLWNNFNRRLAQIFLAEIETYTQSSTNVYVMSHVAVPFDPVLSTS